MRLGDRQAVSSSLGIAPEWSTLRQVHGTRLRTVAEPGPAGDADGLITERQGLPLVVMTADCGGVVLESSDAVAVVHAGWRGTVDGVVARAAAVLGTVERAALGPVIGSCCFEVGADVADRFPGFVTSTTSGSTSVDLAAAIRSQLPDVDWWEAGVCTRCDAGWFSHRGSGTSKRLAAIGWIP